MLSCSHKKYQRVKSWKKSSNMTTFRTTKAVRLSHKQRSNHRICSKHGRSLLEDDNSTVLAQTGRGHDGLKHCGYALNADDNHSATKPRKGSSRRDRLTDLAKISFGPLPQVVTALVHNNISPGPRQSIGQSNLQFMAKLVNNVKRQVRNGALRGHHPERCQTGRHHSVRHKCYYPQPSAH